MRSYQRLQESTVNTDAYFLFSKVYKGRVMMINFYDKQDELFFVSLGSSINQSN